MEKAGTYDKEAVTSMAENLNENNLSNSNDPLSDAQYMPRPRIDKILDQATQSKLVYVVAGAGYGKTQAVRNYIENQPDAVVRWVHLTESDNIGSRYWENMVHKIAFDNPELTAKLSEFGFPDTLARFKQFAEILKSSEHRSRKTFLVLDDFHLIHSKQTLIFAERCAYLRIPGACVIIISRKEPEINTVSLFAKKQVSIVTEDELRFTDDEISEYLRQRGIPFAAQNLPRLVDATKGWALAIQLLSLVLKRMPENFDAALDIMKQNVFKLMEIEAWNEFPEDIQKKLVQSSLVFDLSLASWRDLSGDAAFMKNHPQLASFIWFDSFIGDYRIHPLYLEFLQSRQDVLTYDEKLDTYRQAAQWCDENNLHMDAVKYFAKSRQYERMLEVLVSYPFKLPRDKCENFMEIINELAPDCTETNDQSLLLLNALYMPLLLLWTDRFDEAKERCFTVIKEWENSKWPFAANLLFTSYSILAYIGIYTCIYTHKYDFLDNLKKAVKYYKQLSIPPVDIRGSFAIADVRSFACLVGEGADMAELDMFVETIKEAAKYISETPHRMYYGYEELVACELAFNKNQLKTASSHAHQAILKAREKNQRSVEAMAAFYLFHIALHEGDYRLAKEILEQGRDNSSNPNFWNRQLFYNLVSGFVYAQIGLPGTEPTWLAMAERDTALEVSVPVRELIYAVKYYFATKKYKRALTLLTNSYPREPQYRFLFGELMLTLLTAAARLHTDDSAAAVRDLEKAYILSFDGTFEMPFIELGKDMHLLSVAALKQADCPIPDEWLKTIDRKSSVYAKKIAVVVNTFKKDKNIEEPVQLSEREQEVLSDLYQGLSREEIAETRYLSINTIHKIIQSIYIKLDAYSKADAIRVAVDKKLLE